VRRSQKIRFVIITATLSSQHHMILHISARNFLVSFEWLPSDVILLGSGVLRTGELSLVPWQLCSLTLRRCNRVTRGEVKRTRGEARVNSGGNPLSALGPSSVSNRHTVPVGPERPIKWHSFTHLNGTNIIHFYVRCSFCWLWTYNYDIRVWSGTRSTQSREHNWGGAWKKQ
jgi:hypothetical protein